MGDVTQLARNGWLMLSLKWRHSETALSLATRRLTQLITSPDKMDECEPDERVGQPKPPIETGVAYSDANDWQHRKIMPCHPTLGLDTDHQRTCEREDHHP